VQNALFDKAKTNLANKTFTATTVEQVKQLVEAHGGGFVKTMWCGDEQCELDMKEQAGVSSRCIPFEQENLGDVCPVCGKPAKKMIIWGIAY
jgi:prolyl-tRNA synthetase